MGAWVRMVARPRLSATTRVATALPSTIDLHARRAAGTIVGEKDMLPCAIERQGTHRGRHGWRPPESYLWRLFFAGLTVLFRLCLGLFFCFSFLALSPRFLLYQAACSAPDLSCSDPAGSDSGMVLLPRVPFCRLLCVRNSFVALSFRHRRSFGSLVHQGDAENAIVVGREFPAAIVLRRIHLRDQRAETSRMKRRGTKHEPTAGRKRLAAS